MNNHNIIKKIIEYIPKKIWVVTYVDKKDKDSYVWGSYTTLDKALDKVTTLLMTYVLDMMWLTKGEIVKGHIIYIIQILFFQFTGNLFVNDDDLINFWHELGNKMMNECEAKNHINKTPCKLCKKTELYMHIHPFIKKYITTNMENNKFTLRINEYNLLIYKIDERVIDQ